MEQSKFQNFVNSDKNSDSVVKDMAPIQQSDNQISEQIFKTGEIQESVESGNKKASELVKDALNAGIVHTVKNNDDVQGRILKTADIVIDSQLNVAESEALKEDKKSFFELNRDACSYFGYDEKTTGKSHVKLMSWWAWFFNTLYICTIGFFIVAPISFFFHKVSVVIKKQWLVLVLAIGIYVLIILTPFIISWLGRL